MSDGNVTLSIPSAYTHPATHPASMITGLATVATSGKYSDLSGRPSIPSTPNAYVISTYSSGTSWYRKWSDGWIEQGGHTSADYVTFPVAMKNTNYFFSRTNGTGAPASIANQLFTSIIERTKTGARISCDSSVSPVAWCVFGY